MHHVADLLDHSGRVLHLTLSPDGCTVCRCGCSALCLLACTQIREPAVLQLRLQDWEHVHNCAELLGLLALLSGITLQAVFIALASACSLPGHGEAFPFGALLCSSLFDRGVCVVFYIACCTYDAVVWV
jgi:hypothetical protein